jgi:hypothetical protein
VRRERLLEREGGGDRRGGGEGGGVAAAPVGVYAHGQRPADGDRDRSEIVGLVPDLGLVPVEDPGEARPGTSGVPEEVPASEVAVHEGVAGRIERQYLVQLGFRAVSARTGHEREQDRGNVLGEPFPAPGVGERNRVPDRVAGA